MLSIGSLLTLIFLFRLEYFSLAQNPTTYSSLSSECISFISAYPPTVSLYASEICHVCQGLQISPSVEPCCSASNPTACFATSFYGISVTDATVSAPLGLPSTTTTYAYGSVYCDSAISIFESCEAVTPGFDNLCFHDQQSCLCSTSGIWAPSYYDNYWSSCLSWAETVDPSEYSLLGPNTNGIVQSRKCQTWAELTATGGTPSDCLTSASATLSSVSLAGASPSSSNSPSTAAPSSSTSLTTPTASPAGKSGAAVVGIVDPHVSPDLLIWFQTTQSEWRLMSITGGCSSCCHHHCDQHLSRYVRLNPE
jgi:hypothetical protein